MREVIVNLFRCLPYMGAAFAALFIIKVWGPVEFQEGLSWWMVLAPVWATYAFIIGVLILALVGATVSEKFADYLTDRKEDAKLEK